MSRVLIRKNFKFEKELVDKVATILQGRNKNFTQALSTYFQAIIKDPSLLDTLEKKAKQRTGGFIGILDGKIGDIDVKEIKREKSENIS